MADSPTPSPQERPLEAGGANELAVYLRFVWKHKVFVFILTLVMMLGVGSYYLFLPDVYTAQVKILIERPDPGLKFYEEKFLALLTEQDIDYYGTQIAILTGRDLVGKVNEELGIPSGWRVKAQRIPNTRIISLDVWHEDPDLPPKIANKFAEIFIRENAMDSSFLPAQILKLLPEDIEFATDSSMAFVRSLPTVKNDLMVQDLRNEKMRLESHLRELSDRYKPGHPAMRSIDKRLADLDTRINARTNDVLNSLKASLSGEFKVTNIRVFEEALPSSVPLRPNVFRGVLLGFFGGFFLGVFFSVAIERFNPKISHQEDLQGLISAPFLGALPLMSSLREKMRRTVEFFHKCKELNDAAANIRTRLLFLTPHDWQKSFVITSTIPQEGKTISAVFLSLSMALLGEKVLLVDADLRKPSIHPLLGLENQKGLSDFLNDTLSLKEIIQPVHGSSLQVVTAGHLSQNSTQLLGSRKLEEFLRQAEAEFDRVLIDTPPALYIPDALLVSEHAKNVIVISKAEKTLQKDLVRLIEKLASINLQMVGVMINAVNFCHDRVYKLYSFYYKPS
jgi:capsular exopolysaccharide synthesis family protein